jgi:hypothetical protein
MIMSPAAWAGEFSSEYRTNGDWEATGWTSKTPTVGPACWE